MTVEAGSVVDRFAEALEKSVPERHRLGRKAKTVNVFEWWYTFQKVNKLVSKAYADSMVELVKREGIKPPAGFGAILRYVINHILLKKVHYKELVKKGIESPEEIVRMIISAFEAYAAKPEEIEKLIHDRLKAYGLSEARIREYVDLAAKVLTKMAEKLRSYISGGAA